jgi:hypothetical protein
MVERAEKVAAGTRPLKKDRFVRIDAAGTGVDWGLVERARQLAGLKGYVTNLPAETMPGHAVIDAYHDLWQSRRASAWPRATYGPGRSSTTTRKRSRPT